MNEIYKPEKEVGYYNITGKQQYKILFGFTKKPNYVHRLFCKLLLGWKWEDKNDQKYEYT